MKHASLIINGLILIVCFTIAQALAHQGKPIGSINVKTYDKVAFADMAHVPLDSAVKTALQAVPGKALKAALKNMDGSLVYEVQVIKTDRRIIHVEIDAGNSKVLKVETGRKENNIIFG